MSGIDFGIAVRFAGQESQHDAGDRVLDHLALGRKALADLRLALVDRSRAAHRRNLQIIISSIK
jgi:hypothetical protein